MASGPSDDPVVTEYDYGYTCECGVTVSSEQVISGWSAEHADSDTHWDGVLARFDGDDWTSWIEGIKHGLGWAESEGMSEGRDDLIVGIAEALRRRVAK
jgi:hypothetical protein